MKRILSTLVVTAFLTACGGGGSSSNLFTEIKPENTQARAALSVTPDLIDGYYYAYINENQEVMVKVDTERSLFVLAGRCKAENEEALIQAESKYKVLSESSIELQSKLAAKKTFGKNYNCEFEFDNKAKFSYQLNGTTLNLIEDASQEMLQLEKVSDLK